MKSWSMDLSIYWFMGLLTCWFIELLTYWLIDLLTHWFLNFLGFLDLLDFLISWFLVFLNLILWFVGYVVLTFWSVLMHWSLLISVDEFVHWCVGVLMCWCIVIVDYWLLTIDFWSLNVNIWLLIINYGLLFVDFMVNLSIGMLWNYLLMYWSIAGYMWQFHALIQWPFAVRQGWCPSLLDEIDDFIYCYNVDTCHTFAHLFFYLSVSSILDKLFWWMG